MAETLTMMASLGCRLVEEAFLLQCRQKKLKAARRLLIELSENREVVKEVTLEPLYAIQLMMDEKWDGAVPKSRNPDRQMGQTNGLIFLTPSLILFLR